MKPKELTQERNTTHGDFTENARISQELKLTMRSTGHVLSDVHQEAVDMISLKLSRIASGHANFRDHWDDIAGYAHLAAESCATLDE